MTNYEHNDQEELDSRADLVPLVLTRDVKLCPCCGSALPDADLQNHFNALSVQLLDDMLQLLGGSKGLTAHSKGWVGGKEGHGGLPHGPIPLPCHYHWGQ